MAGAELPNSPVWTTMAGRAPPVLKTVGVNCGVVVILGGAVSGCAAFGVGTSCGTCRRAVAVTCGVATGGNFFCAIG